MKNQVLKSAKKKSSDCNVKNLQNMIQKTILSAQKYKLLDIYGANELNICITTLEIIFNDLQLLRNDINNNKLDETTINNRVADIKSELIIIFKNFGTESFKDLVSLITNEDYITEHFNSNLSEKFKLIEYCIHPINFKVMGWKNDHNEENKKVLQKNRIVEDSMILENADNLECFDLARTSKSFQTKVYGIKIALHDYCEIGRASCRERV